MKDLIAKYKSLFREELFEYCLPFWLKNGIDEKHGGVYTCLDRAGRVYSTD